MNLLQKMFEDLGFKNPTTYLQSGNVVFQEEQCNTDTLEQKISEQILNDFGYEVPVIVMSVERLEQTINNNPFRNDTRKDNSHLHVTFLSSIPDNYRKEAIESIKQKEEEIRFSENVIYLYCPNGYGRTKLNNNFLESKLKVVATTRNWKTTKELFKIANQLQQNSSVPKSRSAND